MTPLGGSYQSAHTLDTFVLRFNITPDVAPLSISWLFQHQGGSLQNITLDPGLFRSLSNDKRSLTLAPVVSQHEGTYTLVATDNQDAGSGSIVLNVQSKLKIKDCDKRSKSRMSTCITLNLLCSKHCFQIWALLKILKMKLNTKEMMLLLIALALENQLQM